MKNLKILLLFSILFISKAAYATIDYQLTREINGDAGKTIIKIQNGVHSSFSSDPKNRDYQDYLKWIKQGGVPLKPNTK